MAALQLSQQTVSDQPKIVSLKLTGEFDLAGAPEADKFFETTYAEQSPKHLLVDMRDLSFAGSDFFASLLFWKEKIAEKGGKLALFGLQPQVESSLRLAVIDRLVPICPDQNAAVEKVNR